MVKYARNTSIDGPRYSQSLLAEQFAREFLGVLPAVGRQRLTHGPEFAGRDDAALFETFDELFDGDRHGLLNTSSGSGIARAHRGECRQFIPQALILSLLNAATASFLKGAQVWVFNGC